ncbi:MAG: DUF4142 domain-containing protein [Candidatus Sulfopaludibacter sp.]|nr:DUF4142 domain-containing protein [Candidatus Sulfopaludibacter sp.]
MSSRLYVLSLAAAVVLTGAAYGQTMPPPGGGGSPMGAPQGSTPGNPGAIPPDHQMDPYTTDKDFVRNVAELSSTEVQLGKLAQDKASSDTVKELGKQMVDGHTKTGEQMKQAAAALKIQLPSEPPRKAKKAEDKLAKLSGPDFDRAYARMAADEQKQAVKQFEREAKDGKVPGVKDFAAKNLPVEQERQKHAEDLASPGTGTAARQK